MVADWPSSEGSVAHRSSAVRGAITGILVGTLGGAIFLGAIYLTRLGIHDFFFSYSRWTGHLKPISYIPVVFVGTGFSALLGTVVEAAIVGRMGHLQRWRAGLLAGGCYLLVLGALASHAWFAPAKLVGAPPNLFGLDMASPIAVLTWVIVAGAAHAARRPTQQG